MMPNCFFTISSTQNAVNFTQKKNKLEHYMTLTTTGYHNVQTDCRLSFSHRISENTGQSHQESFVHQQQHHKKTTYHSYLQFLNAHKITETYNTAWTCTEAHATITEKEIINITSELNSRVQKNRNMFALNAINLQVIQRSPGHTMSWNFKYLDIMVTLYNQRNYINSAQAWMRPVDVFWVQYNSTEFHAVSDSLDLHYFNL